LGVKNTSSLKILLKLTNDRTKTTKQKKANKSTNHSKVSKELKARTGVHKYPRRRKGN